jgi:hypothetical protein
MTMDIHDRLAPPSPFANARARAHAHAHANDNDNDNDSAVGAADEDAANQRPVVTIPARGPEHAYARRGNLILPLRFARRMGGWNIR